MRRSSHFRLGDNSLLPQQFITVKTESKFGNYCDCPFFIGASHGG